MHRLVLIEARRLRIMLGDRMLSVRNMFDIVKIATKEGPRIPGISAAREESCPEIVRLSEFAAQAQASRVLFPHGSR